MDAVEGEEIQVEVEVEKVEVEKVKKTQEAHVWRNFGKISKSARKS